MASKGAAGTSAGSSARARTDGDPHHDADLGKVQIDPVDEGTDAPPEVDLCGLYKKAGSSASTKSKAKTVLTNYVKVNQIPQMLYVYSLTFRRPNPKGTAIVYNKRRDILGAYNALRKSDALNLDARGLTWASDCKSLWCTTPIQDQGNPINSTTSSANITYTQANGETITDLWAEAAYTETLTDLPISLRDTDLADLPESIRALNAYVAQSIEKNQTNTRKAVTRVGANRFYLDRGYVKMQGLRAQRGYFTSIRPGEHETLLNINPATSAFLQPVLVSDFLRTIKNEAYAGRLLSKASVKITYIRSNYVGNPIKTTEAKVHFSSTRREDLLCVNVGKPVQIHSTADNNDDESLMRKQSEKGAQWVPACLLQITPGQLVTTTLEGQHTQKMIKNVLRYPAANAGLIEKEGLEIVGVKNTGVAAGQAPLAKLGFDIDDELLEVPYKHLDAPVLHYDGSKKTPDLGHWDLRLPKKSVVKFRMPTTIEQFHLLELPKGLLDCTAADAHGALLDQLTAHGMKMTGGDDNKSWTAAKLGQEAKDDIIAKQKSETVPKKPDNLWYIRMFCRHAVTAGTHCGIVVLPDADYDLYASGKRLADFYGRRILFAVGSKFKKESGEFDKQFLSNLALKINLRKGGENHGLDASELHGCFGMELNRADTIVLGADVGHGGVSTRQGSPSVACVVGSIDKDMMCYPGSMRLQAGGQEIIEEPELSSMVKERLRDWHKLNKRWPTNMLFYRDGISESQFAECKRLEIAVIKKAYKELAKKDLRLTFVICGKRHNTRFYAKTESATYVENIKIDKKEYKDTANGNAKPGLLVTKVVTNPTPFNFFLQSHKAIKGTARSAHYHVLQDGMGLGTHQLPRLTMKLCYAFSRATTGISYVAPAYIADRLCERGRIYLRQWTLSPNMEPKFEPQAEKDAGGNAIRMTKERMNQEKQRFARELAKHRDICGFNYRPATANDPGWENPWSQNIPAQEMFWL